MSDLRFLADLGAEFERIGLPDPVRRRRAIGRRLPAIAFVALSVVVAFGVVAIVLSVRHSSPTAGPQAPGSPTPQLGSPSQPLSGTIPGKITPWRGRGPLSLAGYGYKITVSPSLAAGSVGWAIGISYSGPAFANGGGASGGGGYPTRKAPVFAGDGVSSFAVGSQRGDSVGFVLTGPQVAAVRFGNRTIATLTSPVLPAGDKAAVFFQPASAPQPVVGWRPGARLGSVPSPSNGSHIRTVWLVPLDVNGHAIPSTPQSLPVVASHFWQAPGAVTPSIHEAPYHGPTHPGPGVCQLSQRGLRGLTPAWGRTIDDIPRVHDALDQVFASCVATEYYLHNWPLTAAVLLDARRPGQALGSIPGARPVFGRPDLVDSEATSLSARRVGNAWLAVQGGSGITQRLRVLQALRVTRLALNGSSR